MSREIRLLKIELTIELDADDADALGEVDGVLGMMGESQAPIPGVRDLAYRITDGCIRTAFEYLNVAGVKAMLDDATSEVSDRQEEKHPEDWFY